MTDGYRPSAVHRWIGLSILVVVLLAGWILLEIASEHAGEAWIAQTWLVVGFSALVIHVVLELLPRRRLERAYGALRTLYDEQCAAIGRSLEEMRFGDLVRCLEPVDGLPGDMRDAVGAAARSMAALIQQIQSSSVEVAIAAATVHETSSELASGTSQLAAAVVEITATTEELARTAGQIASNAAGQAERSTHAQKAGNAGALAIENAAAGVGELRRGIDAIADRADILGSRAREIYRILDLITGIAQETHILALNAAIEASSAGEHGDRFGVVAEEVRRLAERSRESVDSVRSLVDDFSGSIRSVVVATEEGSKSADQVLELSRSTQEAIDQLRTAIDETAQAAREIWLATDEQRMASDQVVLTLREISEVIQRSADGFRQFKGSAQHLDQLALSIQLLTQSFRTDSVHSLKNQVLEWSGRLKDSTANLEAVESVLGEFVQKSRFIELAYLVDRSGTMVAFVVNPEVVADERIKGAVSRGQNYADRPWFQAVARDQRTAVTQLYGSLLTGNQCFTIAAAVHDGSGNMVGTLGIDINVRGWTRI